MSEWPERTPQIFTSTVFFREKDGKRVLVDQNSGLAEVAEFLNKIQNIWDYENHAIKLAVNSNTLLYLRREDERDKSVGLNLYLICKMGDMEKSTRMHIASVVADSESVQFETKSKSAVVKIDKTDLTVVVQYRRDNFTDSFSVPLSPPIP